MREYRSVPVKTYPELLETLNRYGQQGWTPEDVQIPFTFGQFSISKGSILFSRDGIRLEWGPCLSPTLSHYVLEWSVVDGRWLPLATATRDSLHLMIPHDLLDGAVYTFGVTPVDASGNQLALRTIIHSVDRSRTDQWRHDV